MSQLPRLWTRAPLGDVTVACEQRVPEENEVFQYIDIGSVDRVAKRIATPRTIIGRDAPSRARKVVKTGDVLVSLTRPNLNAVALVPSELDEQFASTGFDVLRTLELDSRWIFYVVRSQEFVDRMTSLVRGALYPAIRTSDVRGFVAPFAPAQQQQRIVDKLDDITSRVDLCRAHLSRADAAISKLRDVVLAAATTGKLTEDWRESHGNRSKWETKKLGLLATGFTYGSSAKSNESGEIPVLRMGNIKRGQLDWSDLVFTSDPVEIAKYRLSSGDVLFNRTNTPELVGKTAVYHGDSEAIYAGYLIRVRCRDELLPDYLGYCLNSPAGRQYCWSVKSDSVGQSNINARKLAGFPVPLPSLDEQQEIVRRVQEVLSLADALELRCELSRDALDRFVPELVSWGLSGRLTDLDSDEEAAEALLNRIRAIRHGTAKLPTKRKARVKRVSQAPRAPRERGTMTKSRHDPDVYQKNYLATLLRQLGGPQPVAVLFSRADLPVPDFYKQLAWEIEHGYIDDDPTTLKASDAS